MKKILTVLALISSISLWAQDDEFPSVNPTAVYVTFDGEEVTELEGSQSAPLKAHFYANPQNMGQYSARYEWKIWKEGEEDNLLVHRFEEEIEYTFAEYGSFRVQLYATFVLGNDTIPYPQEGEENPIQISISESKLDFPNAFSPNGDDWNEKLMAKEGWQSIVSFEAAVFNRWGTKIFSWNDPADGWDGKWHGKYVKDGVYFLVVNAVGSEGRKYHIKKTITVLTGHNGPSKSEEGETGTDE
ncbi:MAG: gliding motility-associated C-terminal domain-containing protein [Bacteroidaceae bacterium]|nr:gliding motility-associated C-terminal domain-containing protein [Bacteroidaceae bacterium]